MLVVVRGAAVDDVIKASGEFWDGSFGSFWRGSDESTPFYHACFHSLSLCLYGSLTLLCPLSVEMRTLDCPIRDIWHSDDGTWKVCVPSLSHTQRTTTHFWSVCVCVCNLIRWEGSANETQGTELSNTHTHTHPIESLFSACPCFTVAVDYAHTLVARRWPMESSRCVGKWYSYAWFEGNCYCSHMCSLCFRDMRKQ